MNYFNKILNGNIPANIFDLIKMDKLDKLNQEYPHLQINTNSENGNIAKSIYIELVKKSMKLNYNNIVSSVNNILTYSLNIAIDNNTNEIARMIKSNNDQEINIIINLVVKTFSNELLKIVTKLPLTHRFKDLHIKLFELSGLTGLSLKSINTIAEKLSLEYELTKPLKMTTTINIQQLFYNILIRDSKACSIISFECLLTDEYINKLALTIINIWELILDTIIKSIKYDKIILFYAFSIDFVDQLNIYSSFMKKPRIIEHIIDVLKNDITSDRKRSQDLQDIKKKIDKSKVIAGMAKLLSNAVSTTVSENNADLVRLINISNEISFENVKTGGDMIISGIKQTSDITQDTKIESAQSITNKIVNDISKNLIENINIAALETNIDKKTMTDSGKAGTSVGGIVDSITNVAGKGIDALKDVLSVSLASSTSDISSDDTTKKLKDMFDLNDSFKYEKNTETGEAISNLLTSKNISKCQAKSEAENKLTNKGLNIGGNLIVKDVEQVSIMKDVMKCIFTQTVYNDIAAKIVADYDSTIDSLVENINYKLDDQSKARTEGDIYAMGTAGSAILESVGNAGSKIIAEGGKAGQDLLTGVSEVVKEGGEAATNVGKGMALIPIGIGLGILACLIGIGYIFKVIVGGTPLPETTKTSEMSLAPSAPSAPVDAFINNSDTLEFNSTTSP
jgi:hypothetical protein